MNKRILDTGNESLRQLVSFLDFFNFTIDNQKVNEAAKQKRVLVKKIIINPPFRIE
jgi:hypothetical protein